MSERYRCPRSTGRLQLIPPANPRLFSNAGVRLVDANTQIKIVKANGPRTWMRRGKSAKEAVNDAFTTGLFSVSEIAFDAQHRKALLMYTFVGRTVWKRWDVPV